MATKVKEKNIISVTTEAGKTYKFDVNTGITYGLRGGAIKTCPKEVAMCLQGGCAWHDRVTGENRKKTLVEQYISCVCGDSASAIYNLRSRGSELQIADSLDNMGIELHVTRYYLEKTLRKMAKSKKLVKTYVKYAQAEIKKGNSYSYNDFEQWQEDALLRESFGEYDFSGGVYGYVKNTVKDLLEWATPREIKCFKANFMNEEYLEAQYYLNGESYQCYELIPYSRFKKYCEYCKFLDIKPTTKDDFMVDLMRVTRAYVRQKEVVDADEFIKAMDIHRAEMEFEFGDFQIVIPRSPQHIKDEGRDMHHCVGGYSKNCLDLKNPNRSHIVFVRRKANLEKPYITCEIRNGRIGQYYLSYDRSITNQEDIDFKVAYQQHLDQNWIRE